MIVKIQRYRNISNIKSLKEKIISEKQILTDSPYNLMRILLEDITKKKIDEANLIGLIPPNWNNIYFLDKTPTSELGLDGYDNDFAPGPPYMFRLWKSGQLIFNKNNWLKLGHNSEMITNCDKVEESNSSEKGNIAMVTIRKQYSNMKGISLIDNRIIYYYNKTNDIKSKPFDHYQSVIFNMKDLFRFSALTYNSHQIHYNKDYVRKEGYKDCIVHGPFIICILLQISYNFIRDFTTISRVYYSFFSPLYVNKICTFKFKFSSVKNGDKMIFAWAEDENQHLLLRASIEIK